ncbi:MAG: pseudouridine synthase [Xanthomonadales bacterium]
MTRSRPQENPGTPAPERLQKVMAAAGLGSRRHLEQSIRDGDVLVNGAVATLGQSVRAGDTLTFGERRWTVVSQPVEHRTLVYNKPEGEVTTRSDPQGRPWVAIGRLDINTTGLLLLTTDGELANAMMHPSSNVDREYACRIRGEATPEQIAALLAGVDLEDGKARFTDIQPAGGSGENHWYHVTLMEGRNREVRRLWDSQGLTVSRLKRVRYGAAFLPKRLRMGQWRELGPRDHRVLREDTGLAGAASGLSLKGLRGKAPPGKSNPKTSKRAHKRRKPASRRSRS